MLYIIADTVRTIAYNAILIIAGVVPFFEYFSIIVYIPRNVEKVRRMIII
jgi:hypothetical protein